MKEHLAIMRQPFYRLAGSGEKTIEGRFTKNNIAPFNRINAGDLVYMKPTGKPVGLVVDVERVEFFNPLTPERIKEIFDQYRVELFGPYANSELYDNWVKTRLQSQYGTLIWLSNPRETNREIFHSGMSAWDVLKPASKTLSLSDLTRRRKEDVI